MERYDEGGARGRTEAELKAAGRAAGAGAREATQEGARRARGFLEQQRDVAAHRVGDLAEALRRTARDLEDDGTSELATRAAQGAERLSEALRARDLDELRRDAERFGRRNPGALFGGAFATGLVLSRFLKSTSERPQRDPEHEDEPEVDLPRAPMAQAPASGLGTTPPGFGAAPPGSASPGPAFGSPATGTPRTDPDTRRP